MQIEFEEKNPTLIYLFTFILFFHNYDKGDKCYFVNNCNLHDVCSRFICAINFDRTKDVNSNIYLQDVRYVKEKE